MTILATGAILVFPGLHRSSEYLRYLSNRQGAESVLNNLIISTEQSFKANHHLNDLTPNGEITSAGTTYRYHLEAHPVNGGEQLMELQVSVNWMGENTAGLNRSAYVSD
jgi:hypothetical protein